jgi:hypothetical protein
MTGRSRNSYNKKGRRNVRHRKVKDADTKMMQQ